MHLNFQSSSSKAAGGLLSSGLTCPTSKNISDTPNRNSSPARSVAHSAHSLIVPAHFQFRADLWTAPSTWFSASGYAQGTHRRGMPCAIEITEPCLQHRRALHLRVQRQRSALGTQQVNRPKGMPFSLCFTSKS